MTNPTPTAALKLCRDALEYIERNLLTSTEPHHVLERVIAKSREALNATRATEPALDTERERFEVHIKTTDEYLTPCVQSAWQGWRARAALDKAGEAVGCGKCPRDTPYGPATCGKCLEAAEPVMWQVLGDNGNVLHIISTPKAVARYTEHGHTLVPLYRHPAPQASADAVPVPTSADQAVAMLNLAHMWLTQNAPDRLKASADDERDAARYRYLDEHGNTAKGGRGFTFACWVPVDHKDIGCGIDQAIAALQRKEG